MKTKLTIQPALWITSSFLVAATPTAWAEANAKKPPNNDAQQILDTLNNERTAMVDENGQLDPQEVEHVQRMIRLYELKSGFNVPATGASVQGSYASRNSTTTGDAAELGSDADRRQTILELRTEIVDLRQQLQDLRESSQSQNGGVINESAGAERPTYGNHYGDWPRKP